MKLHSQPQDSNSGLLADIRRLLTGRSSMVRAFREEYAPIHLPDLEHYSEEERNTIVPILNAISNANRVNRLQRKYFLVVEAVCLVMSLASAAIFSYFAKQIADNGTIQFWTVVMMFPLMLAVIVPMAFVLMSRHNKQAGLHAAQLRDIRLAPSLLDLRRLAGLSTLEFIDETLIQVLNATKASDARYFLDRHHRALCSYISYLDPAQLKGQSQKTRFCELRIAMLRCLEQIGDKGDLPYVSQLAKREPRNLFESRVIEAAQECLISLGSRLGGEISRETLLRPAETPDSGILMRAAAGVTELEKATLLRTVEN